MNLNDQYFGTNGYFLVVLQALKSIAKDDSITDTKMHSQTLSLSKKISKAINANKKRNKNRGYQWPLDLLPKALKLLDQISSDSTTENSQAQSTAKSTAKRIRKELDYNKKQNSIRKQRDRIANERESSQQLKDKTTEFMTKQTLSQMPGRYVETTHCHQPFSTGSGKKTGSHSNNN